MTNNDDSNRKASASTKQKEGGASPRAGQRYIGTAIGLVILGCLAAWWANSSDVRYAPVTTVSAFAVLYVLAQGIERLVELTISIVDAVTGDTNFAEGHKRSALEAIKSSSPVKESVSDSGEAKSISEEQRKEEQEKLEKARADLTILTQGLSFSLSIVAVSYVHYGVLGSIGATHLSSPVDRVFTALAIMGGSKALHDLISKVQKSKENEESK